MESHNDHFTIPIDLIQYAVEHRKGRQLSLYLYLKQCSNGIINKEEISFEGICEDLGLRDRRTINKYLNDLKEMDWIGFNPATNNYFIRGFKFLRKKLKSKTRIGAICELSNLRKLRSYLPASLIGFRINRQRMVERKNLRKYAGIKKIMKNGRVAALKKEGAIQLPSPFFIMPYFGLSNDGIGKLLACSKSQANRLKIAASKDGFLQLKKRFKLLTTLDKKDFRLKHYCKEAGKIRFRMNNDGRIRVYEQLFDEITPLIKFKIIK